MSFIRRLQSALSEHLQDAHTVRVGHFTCQRRLEVFCRIFAPCSDCWSPASAAKRRMYSCARARPRAVAAAAAAGRHEVDVAHCTHRSTTSGVRCGVMFIRNPVRSSATSVKRSRTGDAEPFLVGSAPASALRHVRRWKCVDAEWIVTVPF